VTSLASHPALPFNARAASGRGDVDHDARLPWQSTLADWSASVAGIGDLPRATCKDMAAAIDLARRFNEQVVRPRVLALDAAISDDPDLLAHEFLAEANKWGLFSKWLPSMFGGEGWNLLSLYAFVEEVSAECVGLANAVCVHYLGVSTLMATWNMKLIHRIFCEVSAAQYTNQPCMISLAITEPNAGTDVEECALLDVARLGTTAVPQADGSYVINGRKIFISNGHVSTWHMVVAYEERSKAADTMSILAVKTGASGFSFGAKELKMGQKACVASELIFDDCHVPADQVAFNPQTSQRAGRSHREVAQTLIDYVVSSTRAGVGAFATGTAKGALNAALAYASTKLVRGCPSPGSSGGAFGGASGGLPDASGSMVRLIDQQWAQTLLAEMAKNAALSRQAYLESAIANSLGGLFKITFVPLIYWLDHRIPKWLMKPSTTILFSMDWVTHRFQKIFLGQYPHAWQELTSGMASLSKVACSDFGIINTNLAIDLMGADGLRHDHGVEKRLRDAKLLQIYEGTNQLNRVNLFKCLLKPDDAVQIFAREGGQ
jgi:acyl-CoA dehydrogenase